ncbi:hypothetical protein DFH29DRAFT_1068653 [Suillus ampliporus]|nr:hypothetical protein DFH29DRAFT_1068653 [Suillus ampliporus]
MSVYQLDVKGKWDTKGTNDHQVNWSTWSVSSSSTLQFRTVVRTGTILNLTKIRFNVRAIGRTEPLVQSMVRGVVQTGHCDCRLKLRTNFMDLQKTEKCWSPRRGVHASGLDSNAKDYSADDIAAARSLYTYIMIHVPPVHFHSVAMATFWTYDYACSLHQEWTFLLRSRWTRNLYRAFSFSTHHPGDELTSRDSVNFNPNRSPSKCEMLDNICSSLSIILVTCSESISPSRRDAIRARSHGDCLSFPTSAIPGTTGCLNNVVFFIPFLLFSLNWLTNTLQTSIQSWRLSNGPLHAFLVKDNIFYYACGMYIDILHNQHQYHAMFQDSFGVVHEVRFELCETGEDELRFGIRALGRNLCSPVRLFKVNESGASTVNGGG